MARKKTGWSPALKQFWITAALFGFAIWGRGILVRMLPPHNFLYDFAQEWTSARNYLTGHPIYLDMAESIPLHLGNEWRSELIEVNAHPPASILVALPFGLLGYETAYLSWTLLSLIALAYSVHLVVRPQGLGFSHWYLLPIATFLVTSNSLAQQINHGQLNLLLLLLITGSWAALRQERPWLSGALIGIAAGVKLFPAFLMLYFLMQRKWRALAAGIIVAIGVNALAAGVFGWSCYYDYIVEVMPKVGDFDAFWGNASFTGFFSRALALTDDTVPKILVALCSLVTVGLTAWKVWKAKTQEECDLAFSVCIIAMTLVSPITWDHYFLMFVLPFAVLWRHRPPTAPGRLFILAAILGLCFVNPKWVWNATIPGANELVGWGEVGLGADIPEPIVKPFHTVTVLAYQFYFLLALFLFAWWSKPKTEVTEPAQSRSSQVATA